METNHCTCGEALVTRDELMRRSCWSCCGMSWVLGLLDSELAVLAASAITADGQALRAA